GVGRRPVPAGDKQPVSLLRWIEPGGETGMVIRLRLGVQQKAVRVAGDPGIDEIGLAARAFVAESAGMNAVALTDENDTQAVGNGPGVVGGERTPDGKEDAAFRRAIDLHTEIAGAEAIGHEIGTDPILVGGYGHFVIEPGNLFRRIGHGIVEMDGGTTTAPVKEI